MKKELLLTIAAGIAGIAVALGYQTPGSRMNKAEAALDSLQGKVAGHETEIKVMAEDVKYIKRGMDRLLDRMPRRAP